MVLDEVIHDALSKRINNENEYSGGAWAGKRNVARVGGILPNVEECKQHNGYSSELEAASRGTLCSGLLKEDQLCSHVTETQWSSDGESASQKTSQTTTAGS